MFETGMMDLWNQAVLAVFFKSQRWFEELTPAERSELEDLACAELFAFEEDFDTFKELQDEKNRRFAITEADSRSDDLKAVSACLVSAGYGHPLAELLVDILEITGQPGGWAERH